MARILRSTFVLLAFGAVSFPPLAAQDPEVPSGIPPGHFAPTTTFTLNTASSEAAAAFEEGYAAILELHWARAVREMRRAYELDPGFKLARAYEISLTGRSPVLADSIERLWGDYQGAGLVESMLLMSMRERHLGRTGPANLVLNTVARAVPTDWRLTAEFGLYYAAGSAPRRSVARTIRGHMGESYIGHAYTANAVVAPADSADGLRAMAEALRLGPDRPYAHYAAGELLTRLRRHDEAIRHYGHALDIDPTYYQARIGRAQALLYTRRFEEMRRDLARIADDATYVPTGALARRTVAFTYLHEGDMDRAVREMKAVVRQLEAERTWRTQLALAHRALALWAGARRDVEEVERQLAAAAEYRDEDFGPFHLYSTYAWALAGEAGRARAALETVEALEAAGTYSPGAVSLANARAWVALLEGRPDEALERVGTSTNHFALLIGYQALAALGRDTEARQRLEELDDANDFALDSFALAIARYLYGGSASSAG